MIADAPLYDRRQFSTSLRRPRNAPWVRQYRRTLKLCLYKGLSQMGSRSLPRTEGVQQLILAIIDAYLHASGGEKLSDF